jgi:hypothetical protein
VSAHSYAVIGKEAMGLDSAARFQIINFYGMNPGLINSNICSKTLGEGSLGLKITVMLISTLFPGV